MNSVNLSQISLLIWEINEETTALLFLNYQCHENYLWAFWWIQISCLVLANKLTGMNGKINAQISTFLGQHYNTLWNTACVMGISWIFWIITCVTSFLKILHPPLSNMSCVSNTLPRLKIDIIVQGFLGYINMIR